MRLLTRDKIYRVFPELDDYPAQTCERFVAAARKSLAVKLAICAAMLGAFLTGSAFFGFLIGRFVEWYYPLGSDRLTTPQSLFVVFLAGLALVLAASLAYWARDLIIWRRVRYIIHDRGRCRECFYTLIGLSISPDLGVICPECGHVTTVDQSLHELVLDEHGRAHFKPSDHAAIELRPWLTPQQWRRVGRWSLRGLVAMIAIPLLLAGVYEGVLRWQARAASAARPGPQAFVKFFQATQGVGVDPKAHNAWDAWPEVLRKVNEVDPNLGSPNSWNNQWYRAFLELGDFGVALLWRRPSDPPQSPEQREWAINTLDALSRAEMWTAIHEMVQRPSRVFPVKWTRDVPASEGFESGPNARELWNACVLLNGRINLARIRGDAAEFVSAAGDSLELVNMMSLYPSWGRAFADREASTVWYSIQEALVANPSWALQIQEVVSRSKRLPPVADSIHAAKLVSQDSVCWLFEEPGRVRLERWSTDVQGVLGEIRWPRRVGFFEENAAVIEQGYTSFEQAVAQGIGATRAWSPPGGGSHLASTARLPWFTRSVAGSFAAQMLQDGVATSVALEAFRLARGDYPQSLNELVDAGLIRALPMDVYSNQPLIYEKAGPKAAAHGVAFVLYSVGPDGKDDGLVKVSNLPKNPEDTEPGSDYSFPILKAPDGN